MKVSRSFIDGGINSPYSEIVKGKPYYNEGGIIYGKASMSGSVNIYDKPTAQLAFETIVFETAIVAINYNGSGSDKILASFQWGFGNYGQCSNTNSITLSPTVSSQFRAILKNDYPNYSYK
jgi:hypothetical protein